MATVKVDVRRLRQVIDTYQCEVPDGLTDDQLREHVHEAYQEGELVDGVYGSDEDDLDEEVMLDTIELVKEVDADM